MTARAWSCEAYGDSSELVADLDGRPRMIRELCFFEARGECTSAGLCSERMAGERRRLFDVLTEHAAGDDSMLALTAREVLRDVDGPDDLLNATKGDD